MNNHLFVNGILESLKIKKHNKKVGNNGQTI